MAPSCQELRPHGTGDRPLPRGGDGSWDTGSWKENREREQPPAEPRPAGTPPAESPLPLNGLRRRVLWHRKRAARGLAPLLRVQLLHLPCQGEGRENAAGRSNCLTWSYEAFCFIKNVCMH